MTAPSSSDSGFRDQQAWLDRVRGMHRGKRMVGVVGCLIGVLMMLFGRFRPDLAPHWMLMAGLAIVGACWLLFGWIMFDRWRWVKANPYQPPEA